MQIGKQVHASAVALDGKAALLLGKSGTGKSSVAMGLMARGAQLVGDDQVFIEAVGGQLMVRPHPNAQSRMEVRGQGIFKAEVCDLAEVIMVIDLDIPADERLPNLLFFNHNDIQIPLFAGKGVTGIVDFAYLYLNGDIQLENALE